MITLQGLSDGKDVPRELDVELRGQEVYLHAHPPGNTAAGEDILVPNAALTAAMRDGAGRIDGVTPVRRAPKECEVESCPEGLRVKINSDSGKTSWWVLVKPAELEAAIA